MIILIFKLNLEPHACQTTILPLSYTPVPMFSFIADKSEMHNKELAQSHPPR